MSGLLIVERMVLESLSNGPMTIDEIHFSTKLHRALLGNVIPIFLMRDIVVYKKGKYELNMTSGMPWLAKFNNRDNVKLEVKELFTSLVNHFFENEPVDTGLKMKKVWLTSLEKKILQSHLKTLDDFIRGVESDNRRSKGNKQISDKEVVFWGYSPYSTLIDGALEAV